MQKKSQILEINSGENYFKSPHINFKYSELDNIVGDIVSDFAKNQKTVLLHNRMHRTIQATKIVT